MSSVVPEQNLPIFIASVFCITGTFMWSNLVLNARKFIVCVLDPELRIKLRNVWYLRIVLLIHSIGTLVCMFPNVLCSIFSQACPTPLFHGFACGGYTLAEAMSQCVLAARLYLFQFKSKNYIVAIVCVVLIVARLAVGIFQCSSLLIFVHAPWGYWIPVQKPSTIAAVYSLDLINNVVFTGLFSIDLARHYRAIEKHTNPTSLYRMRQILQSAALGGVLAGIGTMIMASMLAGGVAQSEMQIVLIFTELAWNSCIVTNMINGQENDNPQSLSSSPGASPITGQRQVEMSLLTSASVFGARLEAPEPIAERKSPEEVRQYHYDHGIQNKPLSATENLSGTQRTEEEFRGNLRGNTDDDTAPQSPSQSNEPRRVLDQNSTDEAVTSSLPDIVDNEMEVC